VTPYCLLEVADVSEERVALIRHGPMSKFHKQTRQQQTTNLISSCFHDLPFDPEDGTGTFLRNITNILPGDKALYFRRKYF
jgi:hypothetical protein